jgi:hypothetical protein
MSAPWGVPRSAPSAARSAGRSNSGRYSERSVATRSSAPSPEAPSGRGAAAPRSRAAASSSCQQRSSADSRVSCRVRASSPRGEYRPGAHRIVLLTSGDRSLSTPDAVNEATVKYQVPRPRLCRVCRVAAGSVSVTVCDSDAGSVPYLMM